MPDTPQANEVGKLYATALIEIADEQGKLDAVAEQVDQLGQLLRDNDDLVTLMKTPALSANDRAGVIQRLFEGKLDDAVYKLLQVMNRKGRAAELPAMVASFRELVDDRRGIVAVDAFVASELDNATADRVRAEIGQALGDKTVNLTQHVDESLIGGLKVRIGDQLIDASVASQLRTMRQQLIEAGRARAAAASTN